MCRQFYGKSNTRAKGKGPPRHRSAPAAPLKWSELLFAGHVHRNVKRNVLVQTDRDLVLAESPDRLIELNLPALNVEVLRFECRRNILRRDRTEQLIVFTGAAGN